MALLSRRPVLGMFVLAGAGALSGCAAPPPPIPDRRVEAIAAFGTVQAVSASTRQVGVTTLSGGLFDMMAGPEFRDLRRLRRGTRVVVAYGADGTVRLRALPLPAGAGAGWQRGTIRQIEPGGARLVVEGLPEGSGNLLVGEDAMRAFLTRLAPGDEVAVTLATQ